MNIFSQDIDTMKKLQLVAILYMNLMIIRISGKYFVLLMFICHLNTLQSFDFK